MKTHYAIVDIETTGGSASASRITEIAILIHDGVAVIDRWTSLVNPGRDVPVAISRLTGITNEMLRGAPSFEAIAPKVADLLSTRIFVAHNVNFDYSFIRHQLALAGIQWDAPRLCSVRAARKIRPGLRSYSLGNLCAALDIPIENRHRAEGDANATAILFSRLLEWDSEGVIDKMIGRQSTEQRLPPNVPLSDFSQLPSKTGVYYFHNQQGKIIYVGKAINIKKRVAQHFSGNNIKPQRQNFLRDIFRISHEVCGTELMALLLECAQIQTLWPMYNLALKKFEPKFGLLSYEARNGFKYLAVGRLHRQVAPYHTFSHEYEGMNVLIGLADKFEIDKRFCRFGRNPDGKPVQADYTGLPEVSVHNRKIESALDYLQQNKKSYLIVDDGRASGEKSCILVENGRFCAMGYLSSDTDFSDVSPIRESLTPYKSNHYIMQVLEGFVRRNPEKVVWTDGLRYDHDSVRQVTNL